MFAQEKVHCLVTKSTLTYIETCTNRIFKTRYIYIEMEFRNGSLSDLFEYNMAILLIVLCISLNRFIGDEMVRSEKKKQRAPFSAVPQIYTLVANVHRCVAEHAISNATKENVRLFVTSSQCFRS